MKICFITENITDVGGVQRVVTRLANTLSQEHEVTIVSTLDNKTKTQPIYEIDEAVTLDLNHDLMNATFISRVIRTLIKLLNTRTGILNNERRSNLLKKAYFPKQFQTKFAHYINKHQYDVVVGVEGFNSLMLGIIGQDIQSIKIGWQHNSYEAYFENQNRYYWNQDQLFKHHIKDLDQYVVLTHHDEVVLTQKFGVKSQVIHNPISFCSDKKSSVKNKKIVGLGRFTSQKGFDQLIEAFNFISKDYPEWTVDLYGSGGDEAMLTQCIRDYQLEDQVRLYPVTKQVADVLVEASIYAMPSRWEGFGLVVTEALECGVPVVAFDTTGPSEILAGKKCGELVPSGDVLKFAKALDKLMKDEDLRQELSENAIIRANDFSQQQIAKKWNELIKES